MQYPVLPPPDAPTREIQEGLQKLQSYVNATILGIKHWRAIQPLKDEMKKVAHDRILLERALRQRGVHSTPPTAGSAQDVLHRIETGDPVRSKFHGLTGHVAQLQFSPQLLATIFLVDFGPGCPKAWCLGEDLVYLEEI